MTGLSEVSLAISGASQTPQVLFCTRMRPALLSLFLALEALAQTGGATVEGRVLNKLTGAGIAKITVFLRSNTFPQTIYNADTDGSGRYSLAGVKEGVYEAQFLDYEQRYYLTFSGNRRGWVSISGGGTVRIDAEMQPPGRLLAKVVDRNDGVVQHAVVGSGEGREPITGEVLARME
jgi:hypothetical protein